MMFRVRSIALVALLGLLAQCETPPIKIRQAQYVVYLPMVGKPLPKRGVTIAYGWRCEDVAKIQASWFYGWYPHPEPCPGSQAIPMIADEAQMTTPASESDWLMGFNEPDISAIIISPERGAELWNQIESQYPERKLVAPAPSQLNPEWIELFYESYQAQYARSPRLDALALHCYFVTAQDCIALIEWYKALAGKWNIREIWLTEFAFWRDTPNCSLDSAVVELDKLKLWMERDPMLTRYAWYTNRLPQGGKCATVLFDADGLTFWGLHY